VTTPYVQLPVLVTGATGFVGGHLVQRLLEQGARVSVLVRDARRLAPGLAERCRVVEGSLQDAPALAAALQGVAYVFHCAANVATWGAWKDYAAANVQGVHALLDAVEQRQGSALRRLVHVSTMDVYGFPAVPAQESAVLQAVPFGYGESKRQGELAVQARCARSGVSYAILRPGNVVGPGSPFVARIGEALASGWMLTVDGGRVHAGLLDVNNLLDVMLWAGVAPQAHQQAYNVRDPWEMCWRDYIGDLRRGLGGQGRLLDMPYGIARALAKAYAAPFALLGAGREPLLHPLIVQIFGRTCGHSIEKLMTHGAQLGTLGYAQSLRRSLEWFQSRR